MGYDTGWKTVTTRQRAERWKCTYLSCSDIAVVARGDIAGRCKQHDPRPKKPGKPKATKPRWSMDVEPKLGRVCYHQDGLICWPSAKELVALLNRLGAKMPKGGAK